MARYEAFIASIRKIGLFGMPVREQLNLSALGSSSGSRDEIYCVYFHRHEDISSSGGGEAAFNEIDAVSSAEYSTKRVDDLVGDMDSGTASAMVIVASIVGPFVRNTSCLRLTLSNLYRCPVQSE